MVQNKKRNKRYAENIDRVQEDFLIGHYRREWQATEIALQKYELAQRTKKKMLKAGELALWALVAGGALTLALVAPNTIAAFSKAKKHRKFFHEENIDQKMNKLSSNSYFHYEKISKDQYAMQVTKKGQKLAHKFALQNFKLLGEKSWDKKWRIVMFDIDRKNSGARDAFRFKLKQIGMLPIQESVFIYPYHCYEEVVFWSSFFSIEKFIYYLEVEKIFNEDRLTERRLKEHFNFR